MKALTDLFLAVAAAIHACALYQTDGPLNDRGWNVIRSSPALIEMTAGSYTSYELKRLKRNSNVISLVSSEEGEDVDITPKKPRHGNPSTRPSISFSFNQPKASPRWPLLSSPSSDAEPPHPRRHVLNTLYRDASKPSPRAFNEPTASEVEAPPPSHLTLHWIIDNIHTSRPHAYCQFFLFFLEYPNPTLSAIDPHCLELAGTRRTKDDNSCVKFLSALMLFSLAENKNRPYQQVVDDIDNHGKKFEQARKVSK
ncbi:MAG: hypothetical protein LQ341_005560 [Variospora aurantia]|nr:MAG: hypothetical protein LQ341_005560 [Variospora aurantia]